MVQSALSSSPLTTAPRSLAERIAAEIPKPPPEPTVSSMAERFAPEVPKVRQETIRPEPPYRPSLDPTIVPEHIFEAKRGFGSRWLFAGLFGASLVPVALLLVLVSYGGPKFAVPEHSAVAVAVAEPAPAQRAEPVVAQQASAIAGLPAPQAVAAESKPEIALSAPPLLEAKAGDEVPFEISVDSSAGLPDRSVIAVSALPDGAAFSQGRPYGTNQWSLGPEEIGGLKLRVPASAAGESNLRIELSAADGSVLATAATKLKIAPDTKSALILRAGERDRIADLVAHGNKMISVGYFAGARAYYRRAAEAGSGEAALMVGATYDQDFIDVLQIEGIKAEPDAAAEWYDRAKALGIADRDVALAALKKAWTSPDTQVSAEQPAATSTAARLAPSPVKAAGQPEASSGQSTLGRLMAAAGLSDSDWVTVSGAVNVRAEPSSTAEALRVVQKGTKLRATDRKGNWVQVTNPETSETGWIYSRFIATDDQASR